MVFAREQFIDAQGKYAKGTGLFPTFVARKRMRKGRDRGPSLQRARPIAEFGQSTSFSDSSLEIIIPAIVSK